MMAPRRSARIAAMSKTPSVVSVSKESARSEMVNALILDLGMVAVKTFQSIRALRDNLKQRADPNQTELTAEAMTWLTRLSWAIEDCYEYKVRQLTVNCDDTVIQSIPAVLELLRTLASDSESLHMLFLERHVIPRSLVDLSRTFGTAIKDKLYKL